MQAAGQTPTFQLSTDGQSISTLTPHLGWLIILRKLRTKAES